MQNLILTHSTMVYMIASLTNLSLGSFFVCSHIYEKWLKKFRYSLMDVNVLIKGFIVLLSFTIVSPGDLFNGNLVFETGCILLGCIAGYLYFRFELFALRTLPQPKRFALSSQPDITTSKTFNIKNVLKNNIKLDIPKKNNYSYISTGLVGMFEEFLFRGFLTILCLSLTDNYLIITCILGVNVIFALSHINLGYIHIITKSLLGLVCLISFLLLESIVISIVIHMTFNLLAVKKLRELENA